MKKKVGIITIAIIAAIAVIAIILSVTLHLTLFNYGSYVPYADIQREILSMRYEKVDFSGEGADLKRDINADNPVNLITYYGDAEGVEPLWNSLPDSVKSISVLLIIPGNVLNPNNATALANLTSVMDECEKNTIPFCFQIINGETHQEWMLPLKYMENIFQKYSYCFGLSAAELYNASEWRGNLDGDYSQYVIDVIKLCDKYGAFWFWTDTNIFGENGTIIDWIEGSEYLYTTMKENSEHIIMQNKESFGDPSSYSLMLGLYLADLIGGWGVATDNWHWQVSDFKSVFGNQDELVNGEWERIMNYPEAMQVQSLLMVTAYGGFCYKNEAQFLTIAANGNPLAGFQYGLVPFFEKIVSKEIVIPTKEQVLEKIRFAVVGGANYEPINYNLKESNLYPNTGIFGIIPLLPSNLRVEESKVFGSNNIALINEPMTIATSEQFADTTVGGDTFISKVHDTWYFLNNVENQDLTKTAKINKFYVSGAKNMDIIMQPHTYGTFLEESDKLSFFINNYKTDKTALLNGITSEITSPESVMREYFSLDSNGNPLKVSDSAKRTTIIKLQYNGGIEPTVVFNTPENGDSLSRPYTHSEVFLNGVLTITINHNGAVDFYVTTQDGSGVVPDKPSYGNNVKVLNTNYDYSQIAALLLDNKDVLDKQFDYTEISFKNFAEKYYLLLTMQNELTYSNADLDKAIKDFNEAKKILIDITEGKNLLSMYKPGVSRKLDKAFDILIRELTSPTDYIEGKENGLSLRVPYRKDEYSKSVYTIKTSQLKTEYKVLKNELIECNLYV